MKTHLLAALSLAALIATPALAGPACLELGRIWSWKVLDNKTLIVEDDTHQKFKMSLMGLCPDLAFKERIAFKSVGGTDMSCLGQGDYVLAHDIAIPDRCPITSVVPYTPAMEAADKAAAAAKAQQVLEVRDAQMKIRMTAVALLACLVAVPAMADRTCLVIRQINNWNVLDPQTLIVENIAHDKFKVSLYGPCPHIEYNLGVGFKSFGIGSLDCLRKGDELVHNGAGMGNTCPIKSVEPYTPAMQQSDQAAARASGH